MSLCHEHKEQTTVYDEGIWIFGFYIQSSTFVTLVADKLKVKRRSLQNVSKSNVHSITYPLLPL